jgi:hypothetical protein
MGKSCEMTTNSRLFTFEQEVFAAFGALISTFQLHHVETVASGPECAMLFRREAVGLTVKFESGVGPWVQLGRLRGPDEHDGPRRELYDLTFLLQERAPAETQTPGMEDIDDPRLAPALEELAKQTLTYGADVLTGDFEVLPKLRQRALENLHRTEHALYRKL